MSNKTFSDIVKQFDETDISIFESLNNDFVPDQFGSKFYFTVINHEPNTIKENRMFIGNNRIDNISEYKVEVIAESFMKSRGGNVIISVIELSTKNVTVIIETIVGTDSDFKKGIFDTINELDFSNKSDSIELTPCLFGKFPTISITKVTEPISSYTSDIDLNKLSNGEEIYYKRIGVLNSNVYRIVATYTQPE